MDRAERTSFGVALVGHIALFGLLSVGLRSNDSLKLQPESMEVTLSDNVALQSASPTPDAQPPAAQSPDPADVDTPEPPTPQPMPQVQPAPQPRVQPQPAKPQPTPQPQQKPAPAKPAAAAKPAKQTPAKQPSKQRGSLGDLTKGLSDKPRQNAAAGAPAATFGPAQTSALAAEIRRQLRPNWQGKAPTGSDAELLRTVVEVRLARDGSIMGEPRVISQTGVTDGNRSLADIHKERSIRAVKLSAPFKLPAEYYDAWKVIKPVFDKRLG